MSLESDVRAFAGSGVASISSPAACACEETEQTKIEKPKATASNRCFIFRSPTTWSSEPRAPVVVDVREEDGAVRVIPRILAVVVRGSVEAHDAVTVVVCAEVTDDRVLGALRGIAPARARGALASVAFGDAAAGHQRDEQKERSPLHRWEPPVEAPPTPMSGVVAARALASNPMTSFLDRDASEMPERRGITARDARDSAGNDDRGRQSPSQGQST